MAKTVQLNIRISQELADQIEYAARQESLSRNALCRKWIIEGLRRWKLEQAISRYQQGEISLERAAEEAGVSLYDMMDELGQRGVALDSTASQDVH